MLTAQELRIGNWIATLPNEYRLVTAGDISMIAAGAKFANPIPLTPEILEKAGFGKREVTIKDSWFPEGSTTMYYDIELKQLRSISIRIRKDKGQTEYILGSPDFGIYVESVHQLQNLYFALTGEELTVNL